MQEEHLKLTTLCSINLMDTGSAHLALGYSSCMSDLERTGRLEYLEHASRFRSECGNSTRCPCIPATRRNFFGIAVRMPSPQCDNVAQAGGALKAIGSMKYPIPLQKVISRHLALHIPKWQHRFPHNHSQIHCMLGSPILSQASSQTRSWCSCLSWWLCPSNLVLATAL